MQIFKKRCRRAFATMLAAMLMGNSLDLSVMAMQNEEQFSVVDKQDSERNRTSVSDNESQTVSGADDMNSVSGGESAHYYEEIIEMPQAETSAMSMKLFRLRSGTVLLTGTNEPKWIKRLDLTDAGFAMDFYTKLEEASDNDGVDDWLIEDSYFESTYDEDNNELLPQIQLVQFVTTGGTRDEALAAAQAEADMYIPYLQAVTDAFDRDHPEVFWLSGGTMYNRAFVGMATAEGYTYNATISLVLKSSADNYDMRAANYQDQSIIKDAIAERNEYVSTITDAVSGKAVVKQLKYFNEILTRTNEYNTSTDLNSIQHDCRECISALAGKTGTEGPVCEGYARAFKVLCDTVGIPCVLVDGEATGSANESAEAHMWNYVQVENNWYAVDVTWNDPKYVYNGTAQGGAVSGGETEKWFLLGENTIVEEDSNYTFRESHLVSNTVSQNGVAFVNGPVLSADKYVNVVAEVSDGVGVTTQYEDIYMALEAAGTSTGATLKLTKNTKLELEATKYSTKGDFTLDLNGYTLDLGTCTMIVPERATLTIHDSSASGASTGTGKLTSCVQGRGVIENNGTLKVLSGTIEATETTEAAEYTGNYAIYNRNIMEMGGGLLTTNAWHGVGIYNDLGQVTVTGGVVQGSTHAESESSGASGIKGDGDLTITGTPGIYGGGNASGIYCYNGSFKLSGAPVVQGNAAMGDICLENGMVITIAGALTGSDSYSVYSYDDLGVFAVPVTDYIISDTDKTKFTSVMGFDISKNGEGKLVFSHIHEDVSFDKVWDIYSGDVNAGNYVLGSDIEGASAVTITGDVKLCLNGYTLDTGIGINIEEGASLVVCDCSTEETGTIIGYDSSTITNQGVFTLESGKIVNAASVNGTALYNAAGTAIINGGTLRCTGKEAEGIYNCDGAIFFMNDGSVECIEKSSVGIYNEANAATLCLYGGSISVTEEDGVGVYSASSFRLSGAPVIETTEVDFAIDSAECILIEDALTGTESYTLDYEVGDNGYFGNFANASDASYVTNAKEKFIPIQEGVEVLINDTALSLDYLKGDIPISIIWEDEENIHNTRPESVVVVVYANAEFLQNVILEEVKDWEYTLADRYLYDANGAINYTVKLNDANGVYSGTEGTAENGFGITASLKHVHELYLSQSSNWEADTKTIVILCADSGSEECDWSAEDYWVTINGPADLIYDGSVKTASTVDSITGFTNLATVSDIAYYVKNGSEWTAVTKAVDAGTYKAEVTVTMGSDTLTAWVEFEITPVDGASYVEVVPYDDAYDPFAENGVAAVRVDILQSEMNATIEYSTDGGSNWSTAVPVMSSVGSLEVMVKVTAPNYTDYTKTVTAVMTPFDLSNCSVGLEQSDYYYTGQQIKPVVTEITDFFGRELPLTEADYKITYDDNNSVEETGYVYVETTNPNYTGTVETNFGINYYDGAVEVLYNGAENTYEYYNADVAISAEGYTVSKNIDGTYTDTVMLSGEGLWVEMEVYFKQDGTGYITPATLVGAFIDKVAPDFDDDEEGIHIGENYWNTLETIITYDTYFNETQYGFINVSDSGSGMDEEDIYYYIDKSGSTIAKTAEELEACNFVSVADNVQDDDLNAGTEGDFCIDEDGKYVVYAYVVDRVGNKSEYICTNGIVLDTKAPVVEASLPNKEAGTLTNTDMTFTIEADEDAIAVLEIQRVTDTTAEGMIVDSGMTENGFAHLEGLASDTQIEIGSSDGEKYYYKVELSPGEEKVFTLSDLSPNETYMYVIWVFDKPHNLKVIGEELGEDEVKTILVTTLKNIPTFTEKPAITGTYGDELSRMSLSQPASTNGVPGIWSIVYAGAGQRHDIPAVNGTTAYTVKFTPEDTDTYETVTVEVVPTVAKRPLTVTVDNQTRKYGEENPELTYTITEGNIVDANYAGRPRLSIELSTTATKTSDVGVYDITGMVTNDVNYEVTVKKGTLTIEQAKAVITVEAGKTAYSKTFGEDTFVLSGISTNSDGKLSYAVTNNDVVRVDANGKVTVRGAGSAEITVSVAATNNYTAAEAVKITIDVEKADVADVNLSKQYMYLKDTKERINLIGYVPTDAGTVQFLVGDVSGECEFAVSPTVSNGELSYTVKNGNLGDSASFTVTVNTDNYEAFDIIVTVTLVNQMPVIAKKVSLKADKMTFGEALSTLEFAEAVFLAEDTGSVVTGTIAWETPAYQPDVKTTKATWVFTPDDNQYMVATGEIAIVVEKAKQPTFKIVQVTDAIYGQKAPVVLTTEGGQADAEVTISVPEGNGIVATGTMAGGLFESAVLQAGTLVVTAVAKDTTGNYEDAVATYELTVTPAEMKQDWLDWAEGFTGVATYTGEAWVPKVVVRNEKETLVQGKDFTIEYYNNEYAYTLQKGDENFDETKAPKAVIIGKGNYKGTAILSFVINKAENAPNAPKSAKTVANRVTTAAQAGLPADWTWQDATLTLKEGTITVAIAVYNGADKGNYVNETAAVHITRLQAGIPFISEINGEDVEVIENGWEYVAEELETAKEGDVVTVDMNGVTVLPGKVMEEIRGRDITVVLRMDNGIEWSINGKSIVTDKIADVDMKVELDTANIPVDVVNKVTGEIYTMQISLVHNGVFGYTAVLSINVQAENAGYYAQLLHYEEAQRALKFVCEDVIDAEGFVQLPFTHASDYAIVIDDAAYQAPGTGSGSKPTVTPTPVVTATPAPTEATVPTSPKTEDQMAGWMLLWAVTFLVAGTGSAYKRRRKM